MATESVRPAGPGEVEPGVPVREGDYGDRVIAVEPGGVGYIKLSERHGTPRRLFWTWNSANWEFATMALGIVPITVFGGGFWPTTIAVVIGSALGAATVAILSTWGPKFGVPQMVQSRGAFGFFGNFLPAGLNAITTGIGWFAVNTIAGTFALATLTGLTYQAALVVIVVVQVLIAFVGHNFIHEFEKWIFPYLTIVFVLATVIVLAQSNPGQGFNAKAPVPFGGPTGAFSIALFIAFSYGLGWAPYSMDYARYLPPDTNARSVFWAAGLGVFLPCAVLEVGGAALATVPGLAWGPSDSPTDQLAKTLPGVLAGLTLLGIALGTVSANVLNVYSAALSFLAFGIRIGGLHFQRAVVAVVFGVLGYIASRAGEVGAGHAYENFLLVIGYWLTPWLAVVLTDYWIRRSQFSEREFYDKSHNLVAGLAAFLAGIIVSIPFWNQSLFLGPVARAAPWLGDLSFIVGFVVAVGVYYVLAGRRVVVHAPATAG